MNIPKMRTVDEAVKEIKTSDPKSCITGSMLRRWQREGKLPYVAVGTKHLINMDILTDILQNGFEYEETPAIQDYGVIRQIKAY